MRFTSALVCLDRDPKMETDFRQSLRALGVGFIVLQFPGLTLGHFALVLREQAAADIVGNLFRRLRF